MEAYDTASGDLEPGTYAQEVNGSFIANASGSSASATSTAHVAFSLLDPTLDTSRPPPAPKTTDTSVSHFPRSSACRGHLLQPPLRSLTPSAPASSTPDASTTTSASSTAAASIASTTQDKASATSTATSTEIASSVASSSSAASNDTSGRPRPPRRLRNRMEVIAHRRMLHFSLDPLKRREAS